MLARRLISRTAEAEAGGNDFSAATFKALWRFEPGSLLIDSIGNNDLSGTSPDSDTSDYKEGSGCADFEDDSGHYVSRADADLDSGFPCKSGETNDDFSIAFWFKPESHAKRQYVVGKWAFGATGGWAVKLETTQKIRFSWWRTDGNLTHVDHASVLSDGAWYHIGVGFENTNHDYIIAIHDEDGNVVGTHKTGSSWAAMGIDSAPFKVGYDTDARLDEIVHADTKLAAADFQKMALGTYGS